MIPVFQTRFGRPLGNCWAASIASILELPLDAVDWAKGMTAEEVEPPGTNDVSEEWIRRRLEMLRSHGFTTMRTPVHDYSAEEWAPWLHHLALGDTSFGVGHVVVWQNGRVVHDPNPNSGGLVEVEFFEFLVRG